MSFASTMARERVERTRSLCFLRIAIEGRSDIVSRRDFQRDFTVLLSCIVKV